MADVWHQIPGFLRSPNISGDWRLYEVENRAADPEHAIETTMARIAPWRDKVLIDVGAGTGYHIERFHQDAAHVIAVEPDPKLRLERCSASPRCSLRDLRDRASAAPSRSARTRRHAHPLRYFFGPAASRLAELER